jgi:hypothetical protein
MQIVTTSSAYWPYQRATAVAMDIRVRKALNLSIDR